MAITASSIGSLVGRFSNKLVHKQALMSFDALDKGAIAIDNKPDQRGVVNIKAGGFSSTGFISDAGTLPSGDSNDITQLTYDPTFLFSRLEIPRGGAMISNNPSDGVDIVRELMESAGRDLGRHLGRAFYKRKVETIATASSNTSTNANGTFSSIDASQYRIGMTLEHRDTSGNLLATGEVTDISLTAGTNGGTIDTTLDFSTTALADTNVLWAKGTYDNAFVSLDDMADANDTLYGQAVTALEWKGNEDSSTTTLTVESLHDVLVDVERRGDDMPDQLIMNPLNRARLYEVMDGQIRYTGSDTLDNYGKTMQFEGLPIVVDRNCPDTHIFIHNKKHARIHQYREFGPEFDGDAKKGMSRGAVLVSQTKFTWDVQLVGAFQGRCTSRRSLGKMAALTA